MNKKQLKAPGKNSEWKSINLLDNISPIKNIIKSEVKMASSSLIFDKTRKLDFESEGGKFMVMRRTESNETLQKISPFTLQKCVDFVAGSKVEEMKKLGKCTVLIKTRDINQAKKLRKIAGLTEDVKVEVVEHLKLNSSIGVVRSKDFAYLTDGEILEELAAQKVSKIHRVTRTVNAVKIETGTYFVTFQATQAPERIYCGYEAVKVSPYVSEPMRCYNCLRFGHQRLRCKAEKEPICGRCAKPQHLDREKNEKCVNNSFCVNCESTDHGSFDKRCQVYKK